MQDWLVSRLLLGNERGGKVKPLFDKFEHFDFADSGIFYIYRL